MRIQRQRHPSLGLSVALLPLLACGSGGNAATTHAQVDASLPSLHLPALEAGKPEAGRADAVVDAPVDAFNAAVCNSGDASTSLPCGTLAFSKSQVLSRARNHHVTVMTTGATGATFYTIGGFDGANGTLDFVDRIPVGADGSLGSWVSDTPIPFATGGLVGEVVSGSIVIAGGTGITEVYDQAYSAVIQPDGSLAAWTAAGTVGEPRMHAGSFSRGNTMWILGGFDDQTVWSDIVSATVATDGTVSAWAAAGQLPGPMSHFTVTMLDNYVYLTGGESQSAFDNPPELALTWRGQIEADGSIGDWTTMPPLVTGEATHGAFYYGGYLYVCGGINNVPTQEDRCWRSPIGVDHALGTFDEVASLPIARGHVHQPPVFGTHVYSIAGAIDFNLDSTTEIDIGVFDTMNTMKAAPHAHPRTTPSLPATHHKCHGARKASPPRTEP